MDLCCVVQRDGELSEILSTSETVLLPTPVWKGFHLDILFISSFLGIQVKFMVFTSHLNKNVSQNPKCGILLKGAIASLQFSQHF